MANPDAFAALTARMRSGTPDRGERVFERIARLASATDEQQQFMFRRVMLTPEDARDFLAYLATQGVMVTAVPVEGERA